MKFAEVPASSEYTVERKKGNTRLIMELQENLDEDCFLFVVGLYQGSCKIDM